MKVEIYYDMLLGIKQGGQEGCSIENEIIELDCIVDSFGRGEVSTGTSVRCDSGGNRQRFLAALQGREVLPKLSPKV